MIGASQIDSVYCLIVEKRADVVPGAKHNGKAVFVIQILDNSSNDVAMLLLVASCVDRSLLVDTVRDYSDYDFVS